MLSPCFPRMGFFLSVHSFLLVCLFGWLKIVSHYRAVAPAGPELTEIVYLCLLNTVTKDMYYQALLKAGSHWPETHQLGKAGSLASSCNLSTPSSIELARQASITAPSSRDKMSHTSILSTDLATQTHGRIFCSWLICCKWHQNSAAMCLAFLRTSLWCPLPRKWMLGKCHSSSNIIRLSIRFKRKNRYVGLKR